MVFGFLFQDSVGEPEENEEKIVNLELVFGFHLKPETGPQVNCTLSCLDKFQPHLFFFSSGILLPTPPLPAGDLTLSKFIDFIK